MARSMANWRNRILKEFTPGVAPLTLVADPDGLLIEETLLEAIRGRGFEILPFENSVAFRFAYESRFRSRRDRGETADLVVVVCAESHQLATLPYDLLRVGRQLSFGLGELFPGLSHPVVASLDHGHLAALHRAWIRHGRDRLGDNATKDFALLHVFDIAPALVRQPADLLRVLLRRHYRDKRLARILDDRLIHLLRRDGAFDSWPLEAIVPDRDAFFSFLQERWPLFLARLAGNDIGDSPRNGNGSSGLDLAGPVDLPFDHDDVRVYIDNLFLEGMLSAVPHEASDSLRGEWASVGIRIDPEADRVRRLERLLETVGASIPGPEARHHEWAAFAYHWAEMVVLRLETATPARLETCARIAELRMEVDRTFLAWIERRYAGLHNQPPDPPVMVHHVPRYLARQRERGSQDKVALIVVDGLALDQWIVLRDVLVDQRPRLRLSESALFAWAPTITSVSRQAIFAGKPPFYFPSSILTTKREELLWTRFWTDHGLTAYEVAYAKGLGDGPLDDIRALLARPRVRALGLVVDKVDRIMHGMELGTAGMHNQVRQWADEGFMAELLDLLLGDGFAVHLTSDHGNIEAEGQGRPSEGAVADVRGERARIYSDAVLRSRVHEQFPDAIAWPAIGLPEDCLALLAPARSAFVREGVRVVGHGGASLEEVVVPWIRIERTAA